jgi:hypothetical protein
MRLAGFDEKTVDGVDVWVNQCGLSYLKGVRLDLAAAICV